MTNINKSSAQSTQLMGRNKAVLLVLSLLIVLIFGLAVVRMSGH